MMIRTSSPAARCLTRAACREISRLLWFFYSVWPWWHPTPSGRRRLVGVVPVLVRSRLCRLQPRFHLLLTFDTDFVVEAFDEAAPSKAVATEPEKCRSSLLYLVMTPPYYTTPLGTIAPPCVNPGLSETANIQGRMNLSHCVN